MERAAVVASLVIAFGLPFSHEFAPLLPFAGRFKPETQELSLESGLSTAVDRIRNGD